MGRRKIQVQLISDDRTRHVTFAKRKAGLIKKAMELSILTGCECALIVIDPSSPQRDLSEYISTGDSRKLLQEYCAKAHLPHERKTNNDYSSMGRRKAKKPKNKGGKKHASSDDEDDSSDDEDTTLTQSTSFSSLPVVQEYPVLESAAAATASSKQLQEEGAMTSLLLAEAQMLPPVPQIAYPIATAPAASSSHHHEQQQQQVKQSKPQQSQQKPAASNSNNNNHPLGLTTEQIQQLNLFSEPVSPEMFQKIMQEAFSAALSATINAPAPILNNNQGNNLTTTIVGTAAVPASSSISSNAFESFLITPTAEQPQLQSSIQDSKRPSAILTKRPMEDSLLISPTAPSATLTTTILPPSPTESILLITPTNTPMLLGAPTPAKKRKNDKFASLQVQVPGLQVPIRMATGTTPTKDSSFLLSPLLPSTTSELFPPTPTN